MPAWHLHELVSPANSLLDSIPWEGEAPAEPLGLLGIN